LRSFCCTLSTVLSFTFNPHPPPYYKAPFPDRLPMRQRATLRYDQTVFCDREVFEFTYMPDELHHCGAQLRELALLARPALRSGSPRSAILRGPPGTLLNRLQMSS